MSSKKKKKKSKDPWRKEKRPQQSLSLSLILLPVPGTVGTPHASAALLAAVLSPMASIVSGLGPTKAIPSSSQRRANVAFSERKP